MTQIQARTTDHVSHEGVTRHQIAASDRDRKRLEIRRVAGVGLATRKLVLNRPLQAPPSLAGLVVGLGRQAPAAGQLAQELQQPQVRPWP